MNINNNMKSSSAIKFSVHIMSAAIVLVAALSMQEVIIKTLDLIPIPSDTIWWNWLIAVFRVLIAFLIVCVFSWFKLVKLDEFL